MQIDVDRLYGHIGEVIFERRKRLGLRQGELAQAASLTRTSVTNLESGRQRISLHKLYEICAFLGLNPCAVIPDLSQVMTFSEDEERAMQAGLSVSQARSVALAAVLLKDSGVEVDFDTLIRALALQSEANDD